MILLMSLSCGTQASPEGQPAPAPAVEPRPLHFVDVSKAAGLNHFAPSWSLAWDDFDGDGDPDLWVANHAVEDTLYRNNGDGTFTDVLPAMFDGKQRTDSHGSVWADFDNDGDADLFQLVGAGGDGTGPNRLYVNQRHADRFVDQAKARGLAYAMGRGRNPTWLDYDGDGRLDLYVSNDVRPDGKAPSRLFLQQADGTFVGKPPIYDNKSRFSHLMDFDGDGVLDLAVQGFPYPMAVHSGTDGSVQERPLTGRGVVDAVPGDFDNDGELELLLVRFNGKADVGVLPGKEGLRVGLSMAKGTQSARLRAKGPVTIEVHDGGQRKIWSPEQIFLGAGGAHPDGISFTVDPSDPKLAGLAEPVPDLLRVLHVGVVDGEIELRAGSNRHGTVSITVAGADEGYVLDPPKTFTPQLWDRVDGAWVDISRPWGLARKTMGCQSATTADFDADGDLDLYFVCALGPGNLPNRLFDNQNGRFVELTDHGAEGPVDRGRGDKGAVADFDGDGYLDIFLINGHGHPPFNVGPHVLLRNEGTSNHWLQIDLRGTASNRDGIGARVAVKSKGGTQWRWQANGAHRAAQDHRRLHIGLGSDTAVDEVVVHWPSGRTQTVKNPAIDRVLVVTEPR